MNRCEFSGIPDNSLPHGGLFVICLWILQLNIDFFVIVAIIIGLVWAGLHHGSKAKVRVNTAGALSVMLLVAGLFSVIFFSAGEVRGLIRGWGFVAGLLCGLYVSTKAGGIVGTLTGLGLAFGAYAITDLI